MVCVPVASLEVVTLPQRRRNALAIPIARWASTINLRDDVWSPVRGERDRTLWSYPAPALLGLIAVAVTFSDLQIDHDRMDIDLLGRTGNELEHIRVLCSDRRFSQLIPRLVTSPRLLLSSTQFQLAAV